MPTARDNSPAREAATRSARGIYDRLMALPRDEGLSNNEWAKKAGVNTSFFTNLRNGSDPSVNNLRSVLSVLNYSLPEFFLDESRGRVLNKPSQQQVESALAQALTTLPKRADRRASYLAEVVLQILGPRGIDLASQPNRDDQGAIGDAEAPVIRHATKTAGLR